MFDAQVVLSPRSSPRGQLLSQYVTVRIVRLDDVDLGLFDYDRYNTLYFFVMNADEQIYMRYGGRDGQSPDTYLNLSSLEAALKKGLELHEQYKAGKLAKTERPKPMSARDYPLLVERTFARGQCVECHLVGDFQNQHREKDGTLDKLMHMFRSPDLKTIGVFLEVPKGLFVKEAKDAAAQAGMQAGDEITHWNGVRVHTFADLQYNYDKLPRAAKTVAATVDRAGKSVDLTIALSGRWWLTEIRYRQLTVDPRVYFDSKPLSEADKKARGLKPDGFASEVTHVDTLAEMMKSHQLKLGDVVYAVDSVETDPDAHTADLYIRLRKSAGESVTLKVLRGTKKLEMPLKTFRMSFRK
ncbi:MAG: PDZ domain-containing protein [Bryobacterales bacterium]|nr:PDZ domain-containing protein [Bryobacterales bacterium]